MIHQVRSVAELALLLTSLSQNAMAQCHIQWLYLAVHGCKTYLNLNLNGAGNLYRRHWLRLVGGVLVGSEL
jgi:hypothetical protein